MVSGTGETPKILSVTPSESSFGAVFERDLDMALWIQLDADPTFLHRFVQHAMGDGRKRWRSAKLSTNESRPGSGETDLQIVVERTSGHRTALLIEDKIKAPFQRGQAQRYIERGESGRRAGEWDDYLTVLVAPEHYITRSVALCWQRTLTIEAAIGWMADDDSRHAMAISEILRRAASGKKSGRQEDPAATNFWRQYLDYASRRFPLLEVELTRSSLTRAGVLKKSLFGSVMLRDSAIEVAHHSRSAWVELRVPRCLQSQLDSAIRTSFSDGMFSSRSGKWPAIRITAPRINPLEPFEHQIDDVRAILEAGERLVHFWKIHQRTLEELMS